MKFTDTEIEKIKNAGFIAQLLIAGTARFGIQDYNHGLLFIGENLFSCYRISRMNGHLIQAKLDSKIKERMKNGNVDTVIEFLTAQMFNLKEFRKNQRKRLLKKLYE